MKVCQLNPGNFSCRTMGVPWEIQTWEGKGGGVQLGRPVEYFSNSYSMSSNYCYLVFIQGFWMFEFKF